MSLQFTAPYLLLLLLLLPGVLFAWRRARRLGDEALRSLWRGSVADRRRLQPTFLIAAGVLALVAAAGPTFGVERARSRREAADVIFVVDVSRSMAVEDVEPSRLAAAKSALVTTLERIEGQRVGVVVFGGSARLRFPLTSDLHAAADVIQGIQPGMRLVEGGSSLANGLRVALESFDPDRTSGRLVLLLTDGDDLGASPLVAAELIRRAGVRFLVVGVGTTGGGRVPVFDPRTDRFVDKLSASGAPVVSSLDEALLQRLAETGGGVYLGNDLRLMPSAVAGRTALLERAETDARTLEFPIPRFHLFAGGALALVVATSVWHLAAVRPWRRRTGIIAFAVAGVLLASCASAAYQENETARGLYERGDLPGAVEHLFAAAAADPGDDTVARNLATALISAGQYDDGARIARRAARIGVGENQIKALKLLGQAEFARDELDAALAAFHQALILDPSDDLARHDYEVVWRLLEEREEQQGPPDGDVGDQETPPADASPAPGAQPTPDSGGTDGQGSTGSDGRDGNGGSDGGELPDSVESLEAQIERIDKEVAGMLDDGHTPTAEEAEGLLDLLSERARLNMLRDAFSVGSDPTDY